MRIICPCYAEETKYAKPLLETFQAKAPNFCSCVLFYGVGEEFTNFYETKVIRVVEILRELDDEIVMLCDSFDVIVNKPLDNLEQDFKDLKCKMLISAEANCFPFNDYAKFLAKNSNTVLKYPCAGCWIGYKQFIIDLFTSRYTLRNYKLWEQYTDQGLLEMLYYRDLIEKKRDIKIDSKAKIFINTFLLNEKEHITIENKVLTFNETGNTPYLIHFNGDGKVHMPIFGYEYKK